MDTTAGAAALSFLLVGTILNPTTSRELEIHRDSLLAVDEDGFISHFEGADTAASKALLASVPEEKVIKLGEHGWLLPSFVDTHIHAPQYLNAGTALDKPLMEWLEHYTFSSEARIDADPSGLGERVYSKLVSRLLESGTTLASVFGTLTVEANMVLARCFLEAGIRGHIGKVNMDLNGIATYIETTSQSLSRTRDFISSLSALVEPLPPHRRLVQPVITPRFIPTCSSDLMKGLMEIADEGGLRVQSHMCESEGEVEWSVGMWEGKTDVQVLHEHGLLNSRSLMAHCTHSSPADLSLLSSTGTSIAHCPLSNVYFSAEKMLPLREALTAGVNVGLGSDISGGYELGIQQSMRWAVGVSRSREGFRTSGRELKGESLAFSWRESIYLATLGGALALGMGDQVGSFAVGKSFDAQWIQLGRKGSRVDWFDDMEGKTEELVEKWWCNGREEDRVGVWVQGRRLREL